MVNALNFGGRRVELIRQSELSECGLACLAMVAQYHGLSVDLATLRRRFMPQTRGATLFSIISYAERLGLIARPLKVDLEDLGAVTTPAILHWNMNHFIVLEKVQGTKVFIHDPTGNSRWVEIEEVSRRFTGILLELSPSNDFKVGDHRHHLRIRQLWSKMHGFGTAAAQALTLSILVQALALTLPYFSQLAIDRALNQGNQESLNVLAFCFVSISIVYSIIYWLRSQVILFGGVSIGYGLYTNLARRMFRLPIEWFNNRHVSDITTRFQSLRPIRKLISEDLISACIDGGFAFFTIVLMTIYSPILTMIPIVSLSLFFIIRSILFRAKNQKEYDSIVSKNLPNLIAIIINPEWSERKINSKIKKAYELHQPKIQKIENKVYFHFTFKNCYSEKIFFF